MAFVIDASIIVAFAFEDAANPRVALAIERLTTDEAAAPVLFHFEVRNALLVNERRGRISAEGSIAFLNILAKWPIRFASPPHDEALMDIARRRKLTVYDAAYLELAIREGVPLATLDQDLETAARAEGVAMIGA
jgi:predicted nucleic acid-binding protein